MSFLKLWCLNAYLGSDYKLIDSDYRWRRKSTKKIPNSRLCRRSWRLCKGLHKGAALSSFCNLFDYCICIIFFIPKYFPAPIIIQSILMRVSIIVSSALIWFIVISNFQFVQCPLMIARDAGNCRHRSSNIGKANSLVSSFNVV